MLRPTTASAGRSTTGTHSLRVEEVQDPAYRTEEDPDLDFSQAVADEEVVADAWDTWRDEVAHARAVYDHLDLDAPVEVHGNEVEVRDIVVHLAEEYARHVGHADLLRECIDGRTGQ